MSLQLVDNVVRVGASADEILEESKGIYKTCIVIGYTEDDDVAISGSALLSDRDALWLIETARQHLFLD